MWLYSFNIDAKVVEVKRYFFVLLLLSVSLASVAQTKWYKFSKDFINSHYPNDSAIGELKASAVSPARNVHRVTCGGNDGELHIGIAGGDIGDAGSQPFSGAADDASVVFGAVVEPVNLTRDTLDAAEALDGQAASFKGYFRVWNEGHDTDTGVASNPAHVMELHPAWAFHGAGQDFDDASSIRPMGGGKGKVFQGYGASKFRPLLTDLNQEQWLHVYEDDSFVYVELEKAQNFYQLPVTVNDVHTVTGGVEAAVDVFSDAGHQNQILSGLHVIANDGSDIAQSLQNQDDIQFLLGIFSVNLRKAATIAAGHQGPDAAVPAPAALEFFAYGVPRGKAVSACSLK